MAAQQGSAGKHRHEEVANTILNAKMKNNMPVCTLSMLDCQVLTIAAQILILNSKKSMQSNAFDIHASSMENVFISISGMIGAGKTTVSCFAFFYSLQLNTLTAACKCVGEPSRFACLP